MATLKTGELAKRLGCHENTIRAWADEFQEFMTPGALAPKRKFTPEDGDVLATVAVMRAEYAPFAAIHKALAAGRRETLPPLPTPEEESARASIQLVAMPEYTRVLDLLRSKEIELERVISERDKALADKDAANQQIADLRGEIGELRGRLEAIESERRPSEWWIRVVLIALVGMLIVGGLALVFLVGRAGG
jgi:DNA-binding transcriptional MerR regulator